VIVVLDSGPLGLVSNPRGNAEAQRCGTWLRGLLNDGVRVVHPEIADYEVRRELLRASRWVGLRSLDAFKSALDYAPITTVVMLRAADLWATVRRQGRPTAPEHALDGDVILAAQVQILARDTDEPLVVATSNVGHLGRFVDARHWSAIT
jgi:hypothetical protein